MIKKGKKMKKKVLTAFFLLFMTGFVSGALGEEISSYTGEPSIYYTNGMNYLKSDQYSNAITEFRKALRENPEDKSSRIQLINAYILRAQYHNNKATDYNKAANDLRSAIFYMKYYENTPVDARYITDLNTMEENLDNILYAINADQTPKGRYMMGKSLRAQGEFAAAIVEFQKAQNDVNYRKGSLANMGEIYYIMNLNNQAVYYLEQAIALDANNSNLHLKLAGAYERLGKTEKAASEYNLAISGSENNEEILLALENIWKQKINVNPNDAEAHANLGAVYQKRNNFDAALAEYNKAEDLNPSNINTRLNIGTLYQAQKEYNTAIAAYDTIIAVNPNYMLPYFYKAQCYRAMGNKDAALENYKLALNLEPANQTVKNEMFDMYSTSMTPQQKLAFFYAELQKDPDNPNLTYQYAYELHKAGKITDSIAYYNQSIKLDPQNEDAYINLAQAYQQKGEFEKARNILTNAKGLFPENQLVKKQLSSIDAESGSLLYSKATELFNQKKYQEAITLYQKILPVTPEALIGIGASYQALNDNATAASYYEKSFAIDSKNADTAYYAALAYSNIENFTKAKNFARKALALDPKNNNAKELLTYVIEQENTVKMDKAISCFDKAQYQQALSLLNAVLAQDAKDANAYYYRGMVYDAQKKYQNAINDYKKALIYNPQMLIANYSIAIDYDYLGQYSNALMYHKKYLAATQKAGETNEYTRYSAKRIQELKKYETKPVAATKPAAKK